MTLRTDDIGFGGFRLMQDTEAFCYGVDAVLLADAAVCGHNERIAELGSGNGAAALIIEAKYAPKEIVGIELQSAMCELARRNAVLNGVDEKLHFVNCDVLDCRDHLQAASFDLVCCNPPYMERGTGSENPSGALQLARHESSACLADFIGAAAWLLHSGGRFVLIHRPSRLVDILSICREVKLEPKSLRFVSPHPGETPNLALVTAVKGAGKELKILPTLAVRNADGSFTEDLLAVYDRQQGGSGQQI